MWQSHTWQAAAVHLHKTGYYSFFFWLTVSVFGIVCNYCFFINFRNAKKGVLNGFQWRRKHLLRLHTWLKDKETYDSFLGMEERSGWTSSWWSCVKRTSSASLEVVDQGLCVKSGTVSLKHCAGERRTFWKLNVALTVISNEMTWDYLKRSLNFFCVEQNGKW